MPFPADLVRHFVWADEVTQVTQSNTAWTNTTWSVTTSNGDLWLPTQNLGSYRNLVVPTLTGTVSTVYYDPQILYQIYTAAYDVPMPSAEYRVRRFGHSPAVIHAGRRAVRRSIDLYLRLRPEAELRRFIAGEAVMIEGCRCRYQIKKTVGIMSHTMHPVNGHIPYSLRMLHPMKTTGCVYLRDTPVLDQVLSFIMHVSDPKGEARLIRNTNWTPPLPHHFYDTLDADALPLAA